MALTADRAVQEQAVEHCADHELVGLALAVTATLTLNRYCTALDLPTSVATPRVSPPKASADLSATVRRREPLRRPVSRLKG